jgi:hypothetical protein
MSAHMVLLRAHRPRPLRALLLNLSRVRATAAKLAARRRERLLQSAVERFDERGWFRSPSLPSEDPSNRRSPMA